MKSSSAADRAGGEVGWGSTKALHQALITSSCSPVSPALCNAVGENSLIPGLSLCLSPQEQDYPAPQGLMLPGHHRHALSRLQQPLAQCRGQTPSLNPGVLSSHIGCCLKQAVCPSSPILPRQPVKTTLLVKEKALPPPTHDSTQNPVSLQQQSAC